MQLQEVKRLASRGEGQHTEFKKKANYPEKIVREIVAFANGDGGTLLLGVDDDGTVSGVRDIEGETFAVNQAIDKWIFPRLAVETTTLKITEKKGVTVFQIPEGLKKPYFIKEAPDSKRGTAYIRCGDESRQASREMREIIRRRLKSKDISFTYGAKEQLLMEHLDAHPSVTISEFRNLAKLPKWIASKTLVRLVLANVLDIRPAEGGDQYFLKLTN